MAQKTYIVKAPALTVHQMVSELRDPVSDKVTGVMQGNGRVVTQGTVLSESEISPVMLEALHDEDHPSHAYVSARLAEHNADVTLPEPFPGYDDLELEQVLGLMSNLPTATVSAIIRYESAHEGREEITTYSIGFGESNVARQKGLVGGPLNEERNEDKPVSRIRSRDDRAEGVVLPGEGVTGTGDPVIAHGSAAAEDEEDDDSPTPQRRASRRGRRARPAAGGSDEGDKSGDGE